LAEIDAVLVTGVGVLVVIIFYTYRLARKAQLHYAHWRDRVPAEMATFDHRIRRELEAIRTEISKLTSEAQTHTQLLGQIGGLGVSRELREISNEIRAFEKRVRELELSVHGETTRMEASATQVEDESVTAKEEQLIETKVETPVETAITEEAERILSRLPSEKSFRFYVGLGQPAGPCASSLKEFCDLIEIVDVKSVEFHTFRSDFENWFKDALGYPQLAEEIAKIREAGITGGELREQIYRVTKNHYDQLNGRSKEY